MIAPPPTRSVSPAGPRGFTLLELLVAMTLTALLAGAMLAITLNIMRSWNQTTGTLSARAQARIVKEVLEDDLATMVRRNDGRIWYRLEFVDETLPFDFLEDYWLENDIAPGRNKPAISEDSAPRRNSSGDWERFGSRGILLQFFTSDPHLNAVAYRIVRQGPFPGSNYPVYQLVRTRMNSAETIQNSLDLHDQTLFLEDPQGLENFALLLEKGRVDIPDSAFPGVTRDILADHVVDFGLVIRDPLSTEESFLFPENLIFPLAASQTPRSSFPVWPREVELYLRILSEEGAQQLRAYEQGLISPDDKGWWDIAETHSSEFRFLIPLPAKGL